MDIRNINLNYLIILSTLLETKNVTAAGHKLGMSQPATSTALSKLRRLFNDELLVAVGREFQLTPKAEALQEPVRELIETIQGIFASDVFSPSDLSGEFVIATADYVPVIFGPHLIEAISEAAPNLTVHFTNLNRNSVEDIKTNEIDMIIAPDSLIVDSTLVSQGIFTDQFVCVYRREEQAKKKLDLESYLQSTHITTAIDGTESFPRQDTHVKEIDDLRAAQRNVLILPYYAVLPIISAKSDVVALVQERLAQKFSAIFPIDYCLPPIELPSFRYAMFWNPRVTENPQHRWMRQLVFSICKENFS